MKRKTVALMGITLLLVLLLTGCGEQRRLKEARGLAQEYLTQLGAQVGDETLTLTDAEAGQFGELLAFTARSEKYGDTFRINVNSDNSVTDSYFALPLQSSAHDAFSALLARTFPGADRTFELSLNRDVVSSALSGKVFSSLREAHEAVGGAMGLVKVTFPSGSPALSDEDLAALLAAMQAEGFCGQLVIADDVRVFTVSEDAVTYTRTDDPPGEVAVYDFP